MEQKRSRRRGEVLERAILDAAWHELGERGWAGFTVEGVAARSGAAKTVIYRRWRNRAHLAQEMLNRAAADGGTGPPSSGSLRSDLLGFLEGMAEFLTTPFGDAARGAVCEGDASVQPSMFGPTPVVAIISTFVEQAVARGELERPPTAFAMNLGHAVVMSEFLHTGHPPSGAELAQIVDGAWLPALRSTTGG